MPWPGFLSTKKPLQGEVNDPSVLTSTDKQLFAHLLIKLPCPLIYTGGGGGEFSVLGTSCYCHQLPLLCTFWKAKWIQFGFQKATEAEYWTLSCTFFPSCMLVSGFFLYWVVYNKILCNSTADLQCFKKLTSYLLNMTISIASAKLIQVSDRLLHWQLIFISSRGQHGQGGGREGLSWSEGHCSTGHNNPVR